MKELLLELIKKQREYIKFLGKDYDNLAALASVHGYKWDEKLIAKGEKFRADIKSLSKQVKEEKQLNK